MTITSESDHGLAAQERQHAILRSIPPEQRLRQALRMNHSMRTLLAAGFRSRHPSWSEAEIARAVADRILYARTG